MKMINKKTERFIERAKEVHGDTYDYSNTIYQRTHDKVIIRCLIHENFYQTPSCHLRGSGCPICSRDKRIKTLTKGVLKNKFEGIIQPKDYKIIPLTQGKFAKVDNEDFGLLKEINWKFGKRGYAANTKLGYMHRLIMKPDKDMVIDHIDNDPLNNRKINLRVCHQHENVKNQLIRTGYSSIYKGVSWDKNRNKWISVISLNGANIHIGRFDTEIEAAKAYDAKAIYLFGEFAHTNF